MKIKILSKRRGRVEEIRIRVGFGEKVGQEEMGKEGWVLVEKKGGSEGGRGGGRESSLIITRERESVSSLLYNSALMGGGSLFS